MLFETVYIFIFILGLCVGSFLNVLIYRLPRSLSLGGRSFCPQCKKKIFWYDNLPLVSFLLLGGKCRFCHSPISFFYPLVEFLTGFLFVLVVILPPEPNIKYQILNIKYFFILFYHWLIISAFITIFFIDLKHQIIPDQIIYPAVFISFLYRISTPQLLMTNYLMTAFAASFFFLLLHLLTRGRGMGFGDVKLAFLLGLILGWPKISVAFYLAFLTGALVGVILILRGKKKLGQTIPFGPFLTLGGLIALFWGQTVLKWFTAQFF